MVWIATAVHALVHADGVDANPSAKGLPGADFVQQLIDWIAQIGLWGSLATILVGAAMFGVSQHAGNYMGASRGKHVVLGGAVGAAFTGLAPTIVNLVFRASRA